MQTMIQQDQRQEILLRQQRILQCLGRDLLILLSGHECKRNVHLGFPFRQNGNFAYLTGFPEKDSVAVFDPAEPKGTVALFVKEKIRQEEIWQGFATGVKATREGYPVEAAHNIADLEKILKPRLKGRTVHFVPAPLHAHNEGVRKMIADAGAVLKEEDSAFDELARMRVIKSPWEIAQIREAVRITGEAQHAAMRATLRSDHEYQLEAEFEYVCKRQGNRGFSFETIVASGPRATCQHYVANNASLPRDGLILLDGGCEWNLYAGDLTRTWPASGVFSQMQRDLYATVLASEKAGVAAVGTDKRMIEVHNIAARVLIDGLKALGLLHGSTDEILEKDAYKEFWPGSLSHMMGLDVHDPSPAGLYTGKDATAKLQAGMVFTVEPGFYSQDFNHQVPLPYRQIGIRIEDDVLVTDTGVENLSRQVVKEIAEVEAMVQSGRP